MSTRCARDQFAAALRLAAFLALAMLLGACTFPSEGCRPEELVAPTNLSPGDDIVVDGLSPYLTWNYDGPCTPDAFRIELSSSLDWPAGMTAEVEGTTTWWVPPAPLRAAMSYGWTVTPLSGSTDGPDAGESFRTGPLCTGDDPDDYAAPILVSPPDGTAVELTYITFSDGTRVPSVSFHMVWDNPGSCLPSEGYHVEVSPSPSFRPEALIDDFHSTGQRMLFFFAPGEEWEECAPYYWRVSPYLPGFTDGPISETWSFITPSASGGICPPDVVSRPPGLEPVVTVPPAAGSSAIAGHVWHDVCAVPYASTDIAPPGCILMPDGGMEANGVLDPGEVGISGVTVRLGAGPCPAGDGWTDTTDVSGYYSFSLLSAGTYCVSIDAMDDDNITVLIPGSWTSPYRWYGPGPIEIELPLGEADIQRFNDFGWDHQFLPEPLPESAPVTLMGTTLQNANCRSGPGSLYDVLTSVLRGVELPIVGRNQEGTWLAVQAPGLVAHCWVWDESLQVTGDLSQSPILSAPPLPTGTPVQGCWVQGCQQCPLVCTVPCPANAIPGGACTP